MSIMVLSMFCLWIVDAIGKIFQNFSAHGVIEGMPLKSIIEELTPFGGIDTQSSPVLFSWFRFYLISGFHQVNTFLLKLVCSH